MGNHNNTEAKNGQALQKAANVQAIVPIDGQQTTVHGQQADNCHKNVEKRKGNCYNTLDRDMQMCH